MRTSNGEGLGRSFGRGQGRCHYLQSSRRWLVRAFYEMYKYVLACLSETVVAVVEDTES